MKSSMELPNYFLVDLPPEADLTPKMVGEACRTLKDNRKSYLAERSTASLVKSLTSLAECWLDSDYPLRRLALEEGPGRTGFSRETLAAGLDAFFRQLTPEHFEAWLVQEFGHPRRLDELVSSRAESKARKSSMAHGPELITHITGGCIPVPVFKSVIAGLLVRSAQFVKCASGTGFLPRLFAHSIYDREGKLGACFEIAEWRGGNDELEGVLFAASDAVTAMGSDETLRRLESRVDHGTRLYGYGHRLSFAYISRKALGGLDPRRVAAQAARDVADWNQLGCLSPHVFYVQQNGEVATEQFADMLAGELELLESREPRGKVSEATAAAIAGRRHFYEVRSAHLRDTSHWFSPESTAWTVIHDADIRFQISCLNRFIHVKAVEDLEQALHGAEEVQGFVSSVGLAAAEEEAPDLAHRLARWGIPRVCPLGRMQHPPLSWHHDGRPVLGEWVRWSDWEF